MSQTVLASADRGEALFNQGYSCAQATLAALHEELGLTFDESLRLASSFGAGMGRLREVCGAVSALYMAVGLKAGYTDPADHDAKTAQYKLVQQFARDFQAEHGSIICRDLLGLGPGPSDPEPEKRTEVYYEKRPCAEYVRSALELYTAWSRQTE